MSGLQKIAYKSLVMLF